VPFADYLIDSNILLRIARRDDPDHAAVDAALTRLALDRATLYYTQQNIVSRVYRRTPHKGRYVKATPSIRKVMGGRKEKIALFQSKTQVITSFPAIPEYLPRNRRCRGFTTTFFGHKSHLQTWTPPTTPGPSAIKLRS
jgi:predicted nucleic acid-binding protein